MKKLMLAGVGFSVLIAGPAMAADLGAPVYRRPLVAVAVYNWTGFYVGGNIGYGWGSARTDVAGGGTDQSFPPPLPPVTGSTTAIGFADSNTARLNGVIGGGRSVTIFN
jgi:outer membrane immunogenic protein